MRIELLWTHFGISGPVVMDASRFWCLARARRDGGNSWRNFRPAGMRIRRGMVSCAGRPESSPILAEGARNSTGSLCRGCVSSRRVIRNRPARRCHARVAIGSCTALTRFRFPVVRDRGWNFAEVTAGGIPLEEINFRTMESKLVPACTWSERCSTAMRRIGGFNFQWAWATGRVAGRAAAASLNAGCER
ncbi:MAG: NAD(P)/FAD-dependent oxidoreductase [Nitrospira sp.]|nr:NAD(P)/FAD-dependent oxidoreductase [Nitrospira sp.]